MCQTGFKCSGISQLGDDLLVLSYEDDSKPAVRIITPNVSDYDEVAFDTLTMRDYGAFKSRDYILTKNDDLNNYFIVSPKDIIVAVEPDDQDHLTWLLENEQFTEALEFCQGKKFKDHNYGSIGREYIRYWISLDQFRVRHIISLLQVNFIKFYTFCSQKFTHNLNPTNSSPKQLKSVSSFCLRLTSGSVRQWPSHQNQPSRH